MGKKNQAKVKGTRKLTKKEKKQMNHLRLMKGKQEKYEPIKPKEANSDKKAA